jgi:cysteinyl-tRNA synthetase
MAKSTGGAPLLSDLTNAGVHLIAYRLFLHGSQYRSQLDFTTDAVEAAQVTLRRLVTRIEPLRPLPTVATFAHAAGLLEDDRAALELLGQVDGAISNDLNVPQLLAALQDALRTEMRDASRRVLVASCDALLGLGLATIKVDELNSRRSTADLDSETVAAIERLVAERTAARDTRDWARADQLRKKLARMNVDLTDTPTGSVWSVR